MNTRLIKCLVAVILLMMANPVFAIEYCADIEPYGSKSFDVTYPIFGGCETFEIDMWIREKGEKGDVLK